MRDAPDVLSTDIVVSSPPDCMVYVHDHMQDAIAAIVTLANNVDASRRGNIAELEAHYGTVRKDYETMVMMHRTNLEATETQIQQFQRNTENSAQIFSQKVWSVVARFAETDQARQNAILKLQEVAQYHHNALKKLHKDLESTKEFQQGVTKWAGTKETQISDLLAREYLEPSYVDERMQRQAEDLRAYTRDLIKELQNQKLVVRPVDAESIFRSLSEKAASQPPEPRNSSPRIVKHFQLRIRPETGLVQ